MKTKIFNVSIFALELFIIIPILIACFYAVPVGDDFSFIFVTYEPRPTNVPYFWYVITDYYKGWMGSFLAVFYLVLIPIHHLFGLGGLHLQLFLTVLLFFAPSVFMTYEAIKYIYKNDDNISLTLGVPILLLVYPLFCNELSEVFYWAAGAEYTFCLIFIFLSIGIYFRYRRIGKGLVLGIVIGFISGGSMLDEAALACAILFFFSCHVLFIQKKFDKSFLIITSAIIGTLVNVLALGNYGRHSFDGASGFISDVLEAARLTIQRLGVVFSDRDSICLIAIISLISIFLGMVVFKESCIRCKLPILVFIYGGISVFITDCPVILGYMSNNINTRNEFVEYLAIDIFLVIAFAYLGGWMVQTFSISKREQILKSILLSMAGLILVFNAVNGEAAKWTPFKMAIHEAKSDFKYHYDAEVDLAKFSERFGR